MGASVNIQDTDCRASRMKPLCIFLLLLCQGLTVRTSGITQDSGVITAKIGENVTLKCHCDDSVVTYLSWYQQSLGGKPLIISTRMRLNKEAAMFPAFKERFDVIAREGINHLMIRNLRLSDSATYYCGSLEFNAIEFGQGAFLHVKASLSNIHAIIHQSAPESLRLGQSVNLSCTATTEPCAGGQSLYWFRQGAAQPAAMYQSTQQCPHEQARMGSCTLNLALKSVSATDAGTYYCAMASCGEIVFGNGTKVMIVAPFHLVYGLIVALAVSTTVLLGLAFIMYKLKKRMCSVCKGTVTHLACSAAPDALIQDSDTLHYAALSLSRTSKRHHQGDSIESECVYSRVKSRK